MNKDFNIDPDVVRALFYGLYDLQDLAYLLQVDLKRIKYHIYIVPPEERYTKFSIPKRNGEARVILAPATALKLIQKRLNAILQIVYKPKPSVHGFLPGRSIVSNASKHTRRKCVVNIDLQDFFPSINFGRVRGLFMGIPYNLDPKVATVIAQICTFDNMLPQGAPSSPIVANMICAKMDSHLQHLAYEHDCYYTRYADDLTFSTYRRYPPKDLAFFDTSGTLNLGAELIAAIEGNGFKINPNKVRIAFYNRRQTVTGITTNHRLNVARRQINQVRAMLHAWDKYGLPAAENEYRLKYDKKLRPYFKRPPSFGDVVKGKIEFIGMVRGKDDILYMKYLSALKRISPSHVKQDVDIAYAVAKSSPFIRTEGKTDWKHLKASLERIKKDGFFTALNLSFDEFEDKKGDEELLRDCKHACKQDNSRINIFVFDRDRTSIIGEVNDNGQWVYWGNRVYSFAIPIPQHRTNYEYVCIEHYYEDKDIMQTDEEGRRLYLATEFNPHSKLHVSNKDISYSGNTKFDGKPKIIDHNVIDRSERSIALTKSRFADYVLTRHQGFGNFCISAFHQIFVIVEEIIRHDSSRFGRKATG